MVRIVQMVALGANEKQGFWVEVLSADRFDLVEDMITNRIIAETFCKHTLNSWKLSVRCIALLLLVEVAIFDTTCEYSSKVTWN